MATVTKFIIKKLHGSLDYELEFKNNVLILVGENGSCKTTILKMFFYVVSLQWAKLSEFNFERIGVVFGNGKSVLLTLDEIKKINIKNSTLIRRLPPSLRREIMIFHESGGASSEYRIRKILERYGYPEDFFEILAHWSEKPWMKTLEGKKKIVREALEDVHFLYLPTYRRIEKDLRATFEDSADVDDFGRGASGVHQEVEGTNFTELVKFGMRDVAQSLRETTGSLKDFFRTKLNNLTLEYLEDIVGNKYDCVKLDCLDDIENDTETIDSIMSRVEDRILPARIKQSLLDRLKKIIALKKLEFKDKIVLHYFLKLRESHRELEIEENKIRQFVDVCGKYLKNKKVSYEASNFDFSISDKSGNNIDLEQLSSGEKQVVSLLSNLYLSGKKKYFVLIDEPELSLSVDWQRKFLLDVYSGDFCGGLFAVTHSPFIFENALDGYARGIGEFKR